MGISKISSYCILLFFIITVVVEANQDTAERPPNIIFILADDLGYGDLGCFGQSIIQTPEIDKMAAMGTRLTQHYSGSTVCSPSRASLLTGMHTGHNRIRGNANLSLRSDDITIAKVLQKAGYKTGIIGKWGLGETDTEGTPTAQGFDFFYGYINQTRAHNSYPDYLWRNGKKEYLDNEVEYIQDTYAAGLGSVARVKKTHSHDLFTKEALAFIETNQKQPFFLFLSYTAPHANNQAAAMGETGMESPTLEPYANENWPIEQKAYAAIITRLDNDVGRILQKIKTLHLEEKTLIIVTSDNGPHAEGGVDPEFFKSASILRGHKRDLYEGGIKIPFIATWPGKIKPGTESDLPTTFWDFFATACDIANSPTPHTIDGRSYLPTLMGQKQDPNIPLYWEFPTTGSGNGSGFQVALRLGDWKAVRSRLLDEDAGATELYNLSQDPSETNDLAQEYPEMVEKLEMLMTTHHRDSKHFPNPPPVRQK